MKVLMIHHFGQIGGGTNSCFDICRMLIESGHEVVLAIPSPLEAVAKVAHDIGVRLIAAPAKVVCLSDHNADSGFVKSLIKHVISTKYIGYWKQLFLSENPDLIMLNSSVQGPMIKIAHQLGIKTICFVRETARETEICFWSRIHRKMLSMADGLAFLTNYDISSWAVPQTGYQVVIPDIVDADRLNVNVEVKICHLLNGNSEAKCILYLGGLNREKGALELLRAFRICLEKNPNLYLVILGDVSGTAFEKLSFAKRMIRSKAIKYLHTCKAVIEQINKETNKVLEIGLVSDVSPWYKQADVVVFPVKKVHQARPIFEAGIYGKPVVVPDYANFKESIIDGYNGLMYQKDNIGDMAQKLLTVVSDEDDAQRMGTNNYHMYCKGHTYEEAQRRLYELIEKVAQ